MANKKAKARAAATRPVRESSAVKVDFSRYPKADLEKMLSAGDEILECYRVLRKTDDNIVGQVLAGQGTFYEYDHYPEGDVFDRETNAQYYYHSHRGSENEHGHFHTFMRRKGIPAGMEPIPYAGEAERPLGDDAICHLIAISMDPYGFPIALFTTNRWVTDESWFTASDVSRLLDRFTIDHTYPCWAVNRWISAMMVLFKPQIIQLVHERDKALADWQARHKGEDVYEDRDLEITSMRHISVEDQIKAVAGALL